MFLTVSTGLLSVTDNQPKSKKQKNMRPCDLRFCAASCKPCAAGSNANKTKRQQKLHIAIGATSLGAKPLQNNPCTCTRSLPSYSRASSNPQDGRGRKINGLIRPKQGTSSTTLRGHKAVRLQLRENIQLQPQTAPWQASQSRSADRFLHHEP